MPTIIINKQAGKLIAVIKQILDDARKRKISYLVKSSSNMEKTEQRYKEYSELLYPGEFEMVSQVLINKETKSRVIFEADYSVEFPEFPIYKGMKIELSNPERYDLDDARFTLKEIRRMMIATAREFYKGNLIPVDELFQIFCIKPEILREQQKSSQIEKDENGG